MVVVDLVLVVDDDLVDELLVLVEVDELLVVLVVDDDRADDVLLDGEELLVEVVDLVLLVNDELVVDVVVDELVVDVVVDELVVDVVVDELVVDVVVDELVFVEFVAAAVDVKVNTLDEVLKLISDDVVEELVLDIWQVTKNRIKFYLIFLKNFCTYQNWTIEILLIEVKYKYSFFSKFKTYFKLKKYM